ncbi:hypothetical protein AB0N07_49025 [Streptomyces sp. NPDC051172]|uniref:hypothetical protein n=1 Tax=Streptomyces sp. NPDC051172 TaxID=3155796 RepID=UPI003423CA5C
MGEPAGPVVVPGAVERLLGLVEALGTAERKPGLAGLGVVGVPLDRAVVGSAAGVMPDPVAADGLGGWPGVQHGVRPREGGGRRCGVRRRATLPDGRAGTRADEGRAWAGSGQGRV